MKHTHTSSSAEDCVPSAVVLEPVARDRADVLQALFELYAHDFSEYVPLALKESGRFEVSAGPLWWSRDDHHAFFLRVAGRLAGFALARRGSQVTDDPEVMDVAEFFVVRGERRRGTGRQAAASLLGSFPGRWEVRIRQENRPALQFWSRVLQTVGAASVQASTCSVAGIAWHVLRLELPGAGEHTQGRSAAPGSRP